LIVHFEKSVKIAVFYPRRLVSLAPELHIGIAGAIRVIGGVHPSDGFAQVLAVKRVKTVALAKTPLAFAVPIEPAGAIVVEREFNDQIRIEGRSLNPIEYQFINDPSAHDFVGRPGTTRRTDN